MPIPRRGEAVTTSMSIWPGKREAESGLHQTPGSYSFVGAGWIKGSTRLRSAWVESTILCSKQPPQAMGKLGRKLWVVWMPGDTKCNHSLLKLRSKSEASRRIINRWDRKKSKNLRNETHLYSEVNIPPSSTSKGHNGLTEVTLQVGHQATLLKKTGKMNYSTMLSTDVLQSNNKLTFSLCNLFRSRFQKEGTVK